MSHDPTDVLAEALAADAGPFVELRYHARRTRSVAVEKGRVDQAKVAEHTGVGVRVLEDGTWGFASTDHLDVASIRHSIDAARRAARSSSAARKNKLAGLPETELARGRFDAPGYDELAGRPIDESLELVLRLEAQTRGHSKSVASASCSYTEVFEDKAVVTTDGAKAWTRLVRPEFRVLAVAEGNGDLQRGYESVGTTGAWDCLFRRRTPEQMSDAAARMAVDLLTAKPPEGGRKTVLLSPSLVGLLTHEAIGHTVEADFVASGSCAAGKLGQRVASDLVTLCDSGGSEYHDGAGGTLLVDDEGVPTQRTEIIKNGILTSYLHDRESAAHFGVAPTGNARAWEYDDQPLIRMRNTYIEPGESSFDELVAGIEDGLILDGPRNGQADANGEFMFGTQSAWRVKNGKRGELVRGVNLSGIAFDVLQTVDGVGNEFQWDLGSGHCGKGQPAKVDAGGPWLRCQVLVGGAQ
tara:strand:- start:1776 stop:3179 length:1404 start_codon:yes stop_codon:yes gene_type:complete